MSTLTFAGSSPQLPWRLSASTWWTRPVRAECLAVLRIGVALVVLLDLLLGYAPCLSEIFGSGTTGSPELFRSRTEAPFWRWSLFHGLHTPLLSGLALVALVILSVWILYRLATPDEGRTPGWRLTLAWLASALVYTLGVWVRATLGEVPDPSVVWVPAALAVLAAAFVVAHRLSFGRISPAFIVVLIASLFLFAFGAMLAHPESDSARTFVQRATTGWGEDFGIIRGAFVVWVVFSFLLLIGAASRLSAVVVWVLTVSFTHLNPELNSKGDAIRNLLLFYLMLCPIGAAWSVDRLWRRWHGESAGPVYVAPWPLRLLLVQLALVYCLTGLFKALSPDWLSGETLHYVLGDLILSRTSQVAFPLPAWSLQGMTWFALVWEITFPIWVLIPRTRTLALLSAVGFHLGTLALLELGGFEFFMFAMLLPLLPWTSWLRFADAPPILESNPTRTPLAARLLGAFVAWQMAFLISANVAGFLGDVPRALPASAERAIDSTLPGWLDRGGQLRQPQETILAVTDAWGQLTDQPQFWAMYRNAPRVPTLPAVELHFDHADSQSERTLLWRSDYEPADLTRYFRLGELRVSRAEQAVTPYLPMLDDLSEEERAEELAPIIEEWVSSNRGLVRNFLAVRLRHIESKKPGLPAPSEVVLVLRQFRTKTPDEAKGWHEPIAIPLARWLPERDVVERYDPVTRQFVALVDAE